MKAIARLKEIKGMNGWRSLDGKDYKSKVKFAQDIRNNGYTVIRIFNNKEIESIKNMKNLLEVVNSKYTDDEIKFVKQCF